MKHPHAEFIAEAMQDTSREIEFRLKQYGDYGTWEDCTLVAVVMTNLDVEFRFSDTVKSSVISSLSDDAIKDIWGSEWAPIKFARSIADAAAQQERKDICKKRKAGASQLDNEAINRFLDDLLAGKI